MNLMTRQKPGLCHSTCLASVQYHLYRPPQIDLHSRHVFLCTVSFIAPLFRCNVYADGELELSVDSLTKWNQQNGNVWTRKKGHPGLCGNFRLKPHSTNSY